MRLPDFTKDVGLNALRQIMGASLGVLKPAENRGTLTKDEIDALTKQGIDVSLDAVRVLPDGTLAYKNSRVILYIRDIAHYRDGEQVNLPRFHVADCKTLEDMRAHDRFERYVVATREDGLFALNVIPRHGPNSMVQNITEPLPVCQNCLGKLRWDGFRYGMDGSTRRDIVGLFSISRFFTVYGKTLVTKSPQHDSHTAPLNLYSADFATVGGRIKAERAYTCDTCGLNLAEHQKYLHAHHKNAQKHDSRPDNIAILCVACHANTHNHSHLKATSGYREFLRLRLSLGVPSNSMAAPRGLAAPRLSPPSTNLAASAPSNWVVAAQEVARVNKLSVQDLRQDGGCLWVEIKDTNHPAAAQLKKLGLQFSAKRRAFWRKN